MVYAIQFIYFPSIRPTSPSGYKLQPVAEMLRHSHEKTTFLASNRSWSQVCEIQYSPPSSLPFKVVLPSFEYGLVLLATLIRGGGGSQAQDHRQAIHAKIRYSVSSTFATGFSLFQALRHIVEMTRN